MVWTLVLLSLLLLYLQNVSLPLILGQKLARLQLLFRMTPLAPWFSPTLGHQVAER